MVDRFCQLHDIWQRQRVDDQRDSGGDGAHSSQLVHCRLGHIRRREDRTMRTEMMRRRSLIVLSQTCLLLTLAAGDGAVVAQSGPATPSVSVRRISSLTSRAVPGDFNGDGIVDL